MASTAKKGGASRAKAAPKEAQDQKPKRQVVYNGRPASNRHFMVNVDVLGAAQSRADEEGVVLSQVLRHGLIDYAAAPARKAKSSLGGMPQAGVKLLAHAWKNSDTVRQNALLAKFHREGGWPLQALADALVKGRAAKSMTRQAVSLRIKDAPEEMPEDLPEVPKLGPRRITSRGPAAKPNGEAKDTAFRIANEDYAPAQARAKKEGAMMSAVVENILRDYSQGKFSVRSLNGDSVKVENGPDGADS